MDKPIVIGLIFLFFIVLLLCLAIEENRALQKELDAMRTENRRLWKALNKEKAPKTRECQKGQSKTITLNVAERAGKVNDYM